MILYIQSAVSRRLGTLQAARLRSRRLAIILRKEVTLMPITLTFHVFGITVTLKLTKKSNNRHSGK